MEESNFCLKIKVRQHTPIIHFQNSPGATLRATELKPKLDKFLKERYLGTNFNLFQKSPEGVYFLNYKVSISCEKLPALSKIERYPCFFAAMGEKYREAPKYLSFTDSVITIRFSSYESKILEWIKVQFPEFLLYHNFGTRQSKGFGSFYIDKSDPLYKTPSVILKDGLQYKIVETDHKTIFSDIDLLYKIMKSGFNYPDHPTFEINGKKRPDYNKRDVNKHAIYIKSFTMCYFLAKETGNEKRAIKESFFRKEVRVKTDGLEKKYVRALLGTTDNMEFRGKERRGKIEIISNEVERYKSPVLFKVVDDRVFVFILNQPLPPSRFDFVYKYRSGDQENSITKPISSPDFNLYNTDYLSKFSEYFSKEKERVLNEISGFTGNIPKVVIDVQKSLNRLTFKTHIK